MRIDRMQPARPVAPGPRGWPLVGVLPALRRDPLGTLLDAARYGPLARLPLGRTTGYLVSAPDTVRYVLTDQRAFRKDPRLQRLRPLIGDGLVASEAELWLRQRRLMQPAFHRSALAGLAQTMAETANAHLDSWQAAAAAGTPLDLAAEMHALTLTIAGKTLFGAEVRADAEAVRAALTTVLATIKRPHDRRCRQALHTLDTIVYRMIGERRAAEDMRADLLGLLLAARDEQTGEPMAERQLRDEVMTLFLAGHETTAAALAWTLILLMQHPKAATHLRAEALAQKSGPTCAAIDLSGLYYTRMVIDESLRLYPPIWMTSRVPTADITLDGYTIPAGASVFISPYVLHRLPAYWTEPATFDPLRFAPEQAQTRPKGVFIPFGSGPRQCIGNAFAHMEMQIVLTAIMQRFQLTLDPATPIRLKVGKTLRPCDPVRAFVRRSGG